MINKLTVLATLAPLPSIDLIVDTPTPHAIVGAGCSGVCEIVSHYAKIRSKPMVSYACTSPIFSDQVRVDEDQSIPPPPLQITISNNNPLPSACRFAPHRTSQNVYPYFVRTSVTDESYADAWIAICLKFGYTKVATIAETKTISTNTIKAFQQKATLNDIEVVYHGTISSGEEASAIGTELSKVRMDEGGGLERSHSNTTHIIVTNNPLFITSIGKELCQHCVHSFI